MDVKLNKSASEKMQLQKQRKKNDEGKNMKNNRFLITVNVLGSAGPIRFVVNENDNVSRVIDTALKFYAREGRLPVLSSDANSYLLYPANAGFDALDPSELIGSPGVRNFLLCKTQRHLLMTEARSEVTAQKGKGSWRTWMNKFQNILIK